MLQGITASVGAGVVAVREQRALHTLSTRLRDAPPAARPPFCRFSIKVWFTRPCAGPLRPNVAVLLGLGTPPSDALGVNTPTTREHRQLSSNEAQRRPNARCQHADRQLTAVPGLVANVFHARECQAASPRLIRFSAAKSSDGHRTSAASVLHAALRFLTWCQSTACPCPVRTTALNCSGRRAQGSPSPAASILEQDIALYAGCGSAVRISRMGDHPLAPASLVDRSGSPSPPHNNSQC